MKYKGVPIENISISSTPSLYLELLLLTIQDHCASLLHFIRSRVVLIVVIVGSWVVISNMPLFQVVEDFTYFAVYWVLLGVASSIGLGTGLHTFVLYLGPHIAKVAIASTHCGYVPDMIPSRWNFNHFEDCREFSGAPIGILGIILAVQIESFLWGFGTALGQIPPYLMSYKAAETRAELKKMKDEAEGHPQSISKEEMKKIQNEKKENQMSNEDIEEILELKRKEKKTLMDRAKIVIYDNMQKYGFYTILACASIPNPLFDLAGITCGYFRIPLRTFLLATAIGKAVIKVHIQMAFIIAIFRKESLEWIISVIRSISDEAAVMAANSFEAQKKVLYEPSTFTDNKPLVARLWDFFIVGMILFFLKSIVDGSVQEKAIELATQGKVHVPTKEE